LGRYVACGNLRVDWGCLIDNGSGLAAIIRALSPIRICCCNLESCMIFLPYLPCKKCVGRIELPLPIQQETTPSQIAWPWGVLSGTFVCPSCGRLSLYWAEDCRWNRAQSTDQHRGSSTLAVHQIDIPCEVERCAGLLHILAVMRIGSHVEDAASLAATTYPSGIPCDNGHPNYARPTQGALRCTAISVSKQGDQLEWASDES
jgi:hypothetical protein